MIGNGLGEPVQWMKSMRSVGCWHDPFVVWFVERLVDERVMQATVNPVDAEVGEEDKEGELDDVVQ